MMLSRLRTYLSDKYQSLVFKILLYFVVSALAIAMILSWNFASRIKPRFDNEVLPNLSQYIQYLVSDIGTPPDIQKAQALANRLPFELRIEGPDLIWSSTRSLLVIDQYDLRTAPNPYQMYQISRRHDKHLLLVENQDYRYLFAVESSFRSESGFRHWILFLMLAGILALLYLGIRRQFQPLTVISSHLKKIGSGQLSDPIKIQGRGELTQLANGINQMAIEIKSMLESKAGLLLAISHELRSPMTRMRINLELVEDNRMQEPLISDLQEMEALVSGLLESERLNTKHAILNRSLFDLAEVADDVIMRYFSDCKIDRSLAPTMVKFDEVRIRLLLKNLIGNACRYSQNSGEAVKVTLQTVEKEVHFCILDKGPGINADELKHITEPFYRTDSARLRKTGGYGLGLYLCKLVAEAHNGYLEIESKAGEGVSVLVRLPSMEDLTIGETD